jgi:hypothetical protein
VLAATRLFVTGATGLRAAGTTRGLVAGFNAGFAAPPPAESDAGAARGREVAVFRVVAVVFITLVPVPVVTLELILGGMGSVLLLSPLL